MNAHRSHQLRRVGWLLTPLVVWAASFLGAWGGAVLAERLGQMNRGLEWMAGGAALAAVAAAAGWLFVVRRVRHGAGADPAAPPGDSPSGSSG